MLNFEGLEMQNWNLPPNTQTVIHILLPAAENTENEPFLHFSDYNSTSKHQNQTTDPISFLHFKTFNI